MARLSIEKARAKYVGNDFRGTTIISLEHSNIGGRTRAVAHCKCHCGKAYHRLFKSILNSPHPNCGCDPRSRKPLPLGHASRNEVLRSYKKHAEKRGLAWNIADEDAFKMFEEACFYCGKFRSNRINDQRYSGFYSYNGIDRLFNDIGYEPGNVVSCCWTHNRMKGTTDVPEFIDSMILGADYLRSTGHDKLFNQRKVA